MINLTSLLFQLWSFHTAKRYKTVNLVDDEDVYYELYEGNISSLIKSYFQNMLYSLTIKHYIFFKVMLWNCCIPTEHQRFISTTIVSLVMNASKLLENPKPYANIIKCYMISVKSSHTWKWIRTFVYIMYDRECMSSFNFFSFI